MRRERATGEMSKFFSYTPKTPDLDRHFRDYIEGKTVAVVGRCMIHEMEQGEFIDGHQVVVRVHQAVPYHPSNKSWSDNLDSPDNDPAQVGQFVPREWHSRIGRRCNVLYPKFRQETFLGDKAGYLKYLDALAESEIKFICRDVMTNQNKHFHSHLMEYYPMRYPSWELRDWMTNMLYERAEPARQICSEKMGVEIPRIKPRGERVESGTLVIADILAQNPKTVYCTGFPCGFDSVLTSELPPCNEHPQPGNLKYLRDLWAFGEITCDPHMQKLFEIFFEG